MVRLYVLGRLGDSLKVRGRTLFPEALEQGLCELGILQKQLTVLLGLRRGAATAIAVLEDGTPEMRATSESYLRTQTQADQVFVLVGPRGTIERTTSGKPKRRGMWKRYVEQSTGAPCLDAGPTQDMR